MKKLKWGVIGAGGIARRRTIPGMIKADNAELIAVMEINMELAESIRAEFGAKRAYDSVDALLADPEVEAVYIATPVGFHYDQAVAAAHAGKHILLEKPLALSSEQSQEIVDICSKAGVKFATGFMMRYHTYHQQLKKLIQGGELGDIVSARAQFTCWYPDIPGAWRQEKAKSGGGALMDLGVHAIDILQYIMGSRVTKVGAIIDTKTFKYDVDDSASLVMAMDNGANAYVDVNFNVPDAAAECHLEFYGTKGSAMASGTLSQEEGGTVRVFRSDSDAGYDAQQNRDTSGFITLTGELGNMYTKEIASFSDSVLNGTAIHVPAEDAVYVQKVCEAAYRSADTNKFVSL